MSKNVLLLKVGSTSYRQKRHRCTRLINATQLSLLTPAPQDNDAEPMPPPLDVEDELSSSVGPNRVIERSGLAIAHGAHQLFVLRSPLEGTLCEKNARCRSSHIEV